MAYKQRYHLQAITTRYLGPTNTKPGRLVAQAEAMRSVVPWDHSLNVNDNHKAAAEKLAHLMGWMDDGAQLHGGGLSHVKASINVWVLVQPEDAHGMADALTAEN